MQNHHTELPGLLASFLNRERVQELVSEHAVVKRQRYFDPYLLLCILVLGFKQSSDKTLSSLCRLYAQEAPKALSDSSFRERFTPELEACFQALFLDLSQKILAMQNLQQALLAKFKEILVSDSTILTLNDSLARLFPGVASPAAAKLHMVMSVNQCSPSAVKICAGTRSDQRLWVIDKTVKNKLLLMDLGYASMRLFARIQRFGGYFVARLKENSNPAVLYNHLSKEDVVDTKFSDYLQYGLDYDLICEFKYKKRQYWGRQRQAKAQFRVVCLWDEDDQKWMWYVTNLPVELYSAQEVGVLYRARWLVELLFDELKTGYGLEQIKVQNPHAIRILIYSALMTLLVSRHLCLNLAQKWKWHYISLKCWWQLFCEATAKLLTALLRPESWGFDVEKRLKACWQKTLTDSARRRKCLFQQVDQGLYYAR